MQERPRIKMPTYRYIKESDRKFVIISGNSRMDRYSLDYYLEAANKSNNYVVVKIHSGKPVAIMLLMSKEQNMLLAMLSVDREYQGQGIGTDLLRLAEVLACKLMKKFLRIEALDTSIGFYVGLGFKMLYSEQDSEWGIITHMEKQLVC
jgi:ribosomal protein S18 acetylase RimI-like enzyme